MVIDFHIHYCPEKYVKPNEAPNGVIRSLITEDGRAGDCIVPLRYNVDKFIENMDYAGVDMAVLTSGAAMRRHDIEECKFTNNDIYQLTQKYPDRFASVAHVPPLGGQAAYDEMKRCRDELGYRGVAIHSTIGDMLLDDPALDPFYEEVQRLGLFLIVHPGPAGPFYDYDIGRSVAREGHLAETTVRLVEGGVLDRFPDLKICMSHLGGHFYACIDRIILYEDKVFWGVQDHPRHSRKAAHPFPYYLKKMYFDTGGIQGNINPVKMALMEIPPSQLLFGTDYPLEIREGITIRKFVKMIRDLPDLTREEKEGIVGGNARKLLGLA